MKFFIAGAGIIFLVNVFALLTGHTFEHEALVLILSYVAFDIVQRMDKA